jgi:hypothetical protein
MSTFVGKIDTVPDEASLNAIVANSPAVLYFYAAWNESSGPGGELMSWFKYEIRIITRNNLPYYHTAQMATVYEVLASKYGEKIRFLKIEAEACPSLSTKYKVTAVPTFVAVHGAKEVSRVEGANPPELNKLAAMLTQMPPPSATGPQARQICSSSFHLN